MCFPESSSDALLIKMDLHAVTTKLSASLTVVNDYQTMIKVHVKCVYSVFDRVYNHKLS